MAVARITLEKRQYQTLVRRLKPHRSDSPAIKRLHNELARAADRPGRTAELTPLELETLADVVTDMPPVRDVITAAQERVREVEVQEMEAVARLRARMDERRGLPPAA